VLAGALLSLLAGPALAQEITEARFSSIMDTVFGRGAWRMTGGYRTPAREDQLRAQGCGPHAARQALEQRGAVLGLEVQDLPVHRRRREVGPRRRAPDRAGLRDDQQPRCRRRDDRHGAA